ncbi:MAG TPA: hypothetical protein VK168_14040 [Saprospiraceae bacterium]|nr:hypothetical protein [Saprospiraceae bacterium]
MLPLFTESQRFAQSWLWIILIGTLFIPVLGLYQQMVVGVPFGNNPMSNAGLAAMLLFEFVLLYLFWSIRLNTEIDQQELRFAFRPFIRRSILWSDVKTAQVVNYGFVGGWGVRYSGSYGKIYNVNGKYGLALELKSGEKICIGTQKPEELKEALRKIGLLNQPIQTPRQ